MNHLRILGKALILATVFLVAVSSVLVEHTTTNSENNRNIGSGLLAYWDFNEGSGNIANDSSGNGFNGLINNCTWVQGINGTALYFDGTSSFVNVSSVADYIRNNNIQTISQVAWVKTTYVRNGQITGQVENHIYAEIQEESDGKVHFWMEDASDADYYVKSTSSIADGGWHLIVGQYNYSTKIMQLWIDTNKVAEKTYTFTPQTNIYNFYIGNGDSGYFKGYIDEVRIYTRTLTQDDINALFYREHEKIIINNDTDLANMASAEGWPGDGSVANPYIISGYVIDAHGDVGIYIGNVSKYFEIRDCMVYNASVLYVTDYRDGSGVILYNVTNGKLENMLVHDAWYAGIKIKDSHHISVNNINSSYNSVMGLWLQNSNNITVENSIFLNNEHAGIDITDSEYNTIRYNTCTKAGNGEGAIMLVGACTNNNTIYMNTASQSPYGIYAEGVYNEIRDNYIDNNTYGILLYGSSTLKNKIIGNYIRDSTYYGIYIYSSSNNILYNNTLIHNNGTTDNYDPSKIQAYDYGNNIWNITRYGNYWRDWALNNNTNDMNEDGIVDYSYHISGGAAVDHYPLRRLDGSAYGRMKPIRINNNTDLQKFVMERGIPGDGSVTMPYIIKNQMIDASGYKNSIFVGNTTLYFVVENCTLVNAVYQSSPYFAGTGITLYNVKNVSVIDNYIKPAGRYGIYIDKSSHIIIRNNNVSITSGWNAIELSYSTYIILQNNTMFHGSIFLWGSDLEHWNTHIISTNNTVNGKPVYYVKDSSGVTVPSDAGEAILANTQNSVVENMNVSNGGTAILLGYSDNNTIANNKVNGSTYHSIFICWYSENNTIENNTVTNSTEDAIGLWNYANNNDVRRNIITKKKNIGIHLDHSFGNIIRDNVVEGPDSSTWNHGVFIYSSSNNIIFNCTIFNNYYDIYIWESSDNNIIEFNMLYGSKDGIFAYSSYLLIRYNNITGNSYYGIRIVGDHNTIYKNILVHNAGSGDTYSSSHIQAYVDGSDNSFNTEQYGNYWQDWAMNNDTNDQNDDGIVDWPYVLQHGYKDEKPLKYKFSTLPKNAEPLAPTNLQAKCGFGFVNLTWDPPKDYPLVHVNKYRIYRNGTLIKEVSGEQTYFNDTSVGDQYQYTYTVSAVNDAGESIDNPQVEVNSPIIPEFSPSAIYLFPLIVALLWFIYRRK